ncbi:MAG: hypothetical protein ABSD46_12350 [Bacteroidota bacterium]
MKYIVIALITCWTTLLYAEDWPREVLSSEGTITMYQPQIESYSGNSLKARAAVSIIPIGKDEPVFGAIWVDCRVMTDRPTRTVKLEQMEVRRTRFPSGTDADTAKIAAALEEMIPRFDLTFSLDLLLVSVETAQKERETAHELELIPPKIIVMDHPAVLVQIDGDPILSDNNGTSLKRVINTPYFLVQDLSGDKFYLRGGDIWFSAKMIKGHWEQTDTPPQSVVDLFEQTKSDEESDEDSTTNDIVSKTGKVPEIVVSTEPTELIATDGPKQLAPIEKTGLLYVSNTPSRVFLEIKTQKYFILISGRWFTAKSLAGAWTSIASDKLPDDFKKIPPGSVCDDVLADVAGTVPAKEAVFDAQIPQMAEVDRADATSQVEYDGDPQFEPIENTGMDYAVNTSTAVIRVNGRYYDCDQGVWFESGTPNGPWKVCINVPEVIYTIPPRYPVYNVRYVRVYTYTPDVVYVGYTSGYTGCYVYGRTVVYGTGYNYHPWYRHSYYARPWTWGFNVHYDPWAGWSFGAGWGQPHGWLARQSRVEHTGWWGPAENHPDYRPSTKPVYREGYHPVYRQTVASTPVGRTSNDVRRTSGMQRPATLYDLRGSSVRRPVASGSPRSPVEIARTTPSPTSPKARPMIRPVTPPVQQPEPSRPAREVTRATPSPTPPETRPIIRPTPTAPQPVTQPISRSTPRIVTRPSPTENNVYAAPDGKILRSTPQGWQQRVQNTWKNAPEAPAKQATIHDSEVRQRAAERTSSSRTPPPPRTEPKSNTGKDERRR